MLTEKELSQIAENFVKELEKKMNIELVLVKKETIKKNYGHIYLYTSKKFYETKDIQFSLAGGGRFLIENSNGKIIQFGSSQTKEYYITEYEAGRYPME